MASEDDLKPKLLIRYSRAVRTKLTRFLAVLTALVLLGGGFTRAEMLFDAAHCHPDLDPSAPSSHHSGGHSNDGGLPCCVDCLGCATFTNSADDPSLSGGPVFFSTTVDYGERSVAHSGRVLAPDTDPPKRSA